MVDDQIISDPVLKDILKTLLFVARWEQRIRASIPGWKEAEQSPALSTVLDQFPGSAITLRDDGYAEVVHKPIGEEGE